MDDKDSGITANDTRAIRQAVREGLDELAVTYTNGALDFTNALAQHWAGVIDAFDKFFLGNLAADRPEVARTVIQARLSSAKEAHKNLEAKVRQLEERMRELGG